MSTYIHTHKVTLVVIQDRRHKYTHPQAGLVSESDWSECYSESESCMDSHIHTSIGMNPYMHTYKYTYQYTHAHTHTRTLGSPGHDSEPEYTYIGHDSESERTYIYAQMHASIHTRIHTHQVALGVIQNQKVSQCYCKMKEL